jgi:hypothetical protein
MGGGVRFCDCNSILNQSLSLLEIKESIAPRTASSHLISCFLVSESFFLGTSSVYHLISYATHVHVQPFPRFHVHGITQLCF